VRKLKSFLTAWVPYLAVRAFALFFRLLGVRISLWLGAEFAKWAYRFNRKRRERVLNHLRIAFPEWDAKRANEVAKQSFIHLVQLVMEVIFTPVKIHQGNYETHLQRKNPEPGLSMLHARQPMLLVTGHFGNWEALGYLLAVEGHAISAVARPLDHAKINDWLVAQRTRRGMQIIEKFAEAPTKILEAIADNRAVGFIADQNGGDNGIFVPFFGKLASTAKTVGLLAQQFNVPVLIGSARRVAKYGLKYEIELAELIRPEDWASQPDPMYYISARYVRAIENLVREHPEEYLWMHRRWKSRPRHEREGKPMPAALERKLRSLPWMTEELIEKIKRDEGKENVRM